VEKVEGRLTGACSRALFALWFERVRDPYKSRCDCFGACRELMREDGIRASAFCFFFFLFRFCKRALAR
jgi:hypothetical protein